MVVSWTKVVAMNMGGGVRVWVYFQGKLTGFADQLGMGSERNRGVKNEAKLWT